MHKWKRTLETEIAFDGLASEEYPISISVVAKDGRPESFDNMDDFIKYTNKLEEMAMRVVNSWFSKDPAYDGFVTNVTKLADFIGE